MSKIKACVAFYVWLKAWISFTYHYMMVWEPGPPRTVSHEEYLEIVKRMETGPMRYEYQRVQELYQRADELWKGTKSP